MRSSFVNYLFPFIIIALLLGCSNNSGSTDIPPENEKPLTDDPKLSNKLIGKWNESCKYTDNVVTIFSTGKISVESAGRLKYGTWSLRQHSLHISYNDQGFELWQLSKINKRKLTYTKDDGICSSTKVKEQA